MLREHRRFLDRIHLASTAFLVVGTYFVLYHLFIHNFLRFKPLGDYMGPIVLFSIVVVATMYIRGFSISARFITPFYIVIEIFTCYIFAILAYGVISYLFKFPHLSRLYLLGGMAASYVVVIVWHLLTHWVLTALRKHHRNFRNIVVIGNQFTIPPLLEVIQGNKAYGLRVAAVIGIDEASDKQDWGFHYEHGIEHLPHILNSEVIDYAVFTVYRQSPAKVERAILECQSRGIEVWLKPDFMQKEIAISRVDYLHDMPVFVLSIGPKLGVQMVLKRFLDILVSASLLAVVSLPMAIIAHLVHRSTPGPVFFRQQRVGLNGRKFYMYKFRTMYHEAPGAERKLELKNEMTGPVFKMKDDPRVTPLGKILRKYSLDELPQLWNILKGDMSLVGPRPPLPSEVDLYQGWQRRRLSMRPGLTCYWQVMGRNKISSFEEWAKLDLKYIDDWSLWTDFKILLRTIPVVIKGTGL